MPAFRPDVAARTLLGVGLVEFAASLAGRSAIDPVGRVVVDAAPLPVVEETVRLAGTTDKPLLRAGLLTAAAAAAGAVAPALRPARGRGDATLVGPVLTASAGVAAYLAGRRRLHALQATQDRARRAVTVSEPLPEVIDGAEQWPHAEPLFTPASAFYATDVNLRPPLVDPAAWRLNLEASGARSAMTLDQLRALELRERDALMVCVHNRLGWDRLGHQRWTGLPVADVFAAAGIDLPTDAPRHDLVMEAVDGYRQVMPLEQVLGRDAWVVVGMDRRELSAAHGFPVRVTTPGVVGQYSGVKWLTRLAVVPAGSVSATWVARGWPRATIVPPPMARLDHPGTARMPPRLPSGPVTVPARTTLVGTAWAPAHGGVAAVEVSVDDGPWQTAELAADLGPSSWRRWRAELDLAPGRHTVAARCRAHDGTVQVGEPSPPFPHGATGHHTVHLKAATPT